MTERPAISLAATPGRRAQAVDLAVEAERRGWPSVWCPSSGLEQLSFCASVLAASTDLVVATAILPIYLRHPGDVAATASYLHEVSGGRFRLGLGVSNPALVEGLGRQPGKPLADVRAFVADLRAAAGRTGPLPPVVLATLRDRMLGLAVEVADGALWEHAALSHVGRQLAGAAADRAAGFGVANMVTTAVDDDRDAAAAACRAALDGFVRLDSYRSYWREAGYGEEMAAIEAALGAGEDDRIPTLMSDRWLADVALWGPAAAVREGVEAWREAGMAPPILVPAAGDGDPLEAARRVLDLYP